MCAPNGCLLRVFEGSPCSPAPLLSDVTVPPCVRSCGENKAGSRPEGKALVHWQTLLLYICYKKVLKLIQNVTL